MKRPVLFVLISYILGIVFCEFFKIDEMFYHLNLITIFIFICISFYCNFNKYIKIFLVFLFLGLFVVGMHKTISDFIYKKNSNFTAEILSVNKFEYGKKYEVRVLNYDNKSINENILMYSNDDFSIGDVVNFSGKLKQITDNSNPNLFNFRRYNLKNKIFNTIYAKNIKKIGVTDDMFLKFKRDFQKHIENIFDYSLSLENSNIIKRIFLGNKYEFSFEESARNIGIAHILAISGLHIGIIYLYFSILFKLLPISKILREIFILGIIFIYSMLIGSPASVLRASIYLSVMFYTKASGKIVDNLSSLYLSAFIILFINPFEIYNVGFYFSFLSVFGILVIFPIISKKKDGLIKNSFKITFSVLLMLAPIMLYVFGKVSIVSFIGNLILIPVFILAIILSFMMIILGTIWIKFAIFIGFTVNLLLDILKYNVEFLNVFKLDLEIFNFNILYIICYYFILYLIHNNEFRIFKLGDIKLILVASIFIFLTTNIYNFNNNLVQINFIDIGQGDSTLIRGKKNILIDTGGITFGKANNGKTVLIPYLKKVGIKKLDYVFISHLDADHCKNLKELSNNIKIKNVFFGKNGYKNYKFKYGDVLADNIIEIDDEININLQDMNIDVFQIKNSIEENDKSIIVKLNVNNTKILFTGDISSNAEISILDNDIDSDVLKIAHHGSKNSSNVEFLNRVSPDVAIISCGKNNKYGHPHKETLKKLENMNIKYLRTDVDGNIILNIDNFSSKIIGYNSLNKNLFDYMSFYNLEILNIILYWISFIIIISCCRREDELYTGDKIT